MTAAAAARAFGTINVVDVLHVVHVLDVLGSVAAIGVLDSIAAIPPAAVRARPPVVRSVITSAIHAARPAIGIRRVIIIIVHVVGTTIFLTVLLGNVARGALGGTILLLHVTRGALGGTVRTGHVASGSLQGLVNSANVGRMGCGVIGTGRDGIADTQPEH